MRKGGEERKMKGWARGSKRYRKKVREKN